VKETFEPGRSVAGVALSHGLNANMVFTWRRDPRFRLENQPASRGVEFLPVSVVAKDVTASARTVEEERGEIELVLREGHRLLLRGDFDADKVRQLVRCLSRS
jgi:transposase